MSDNPATEIPWRDVVAAKDTEIKRLNAALAAAWRKGHADAQAPALERIDELQQQLAAEREVGHNQAVTLGQHIARLEDQLAAALAGNVPAPTKK